MRPEDEGQTFLRLSSPHARVLDDREERELLLGLGECKRKLAEALTSLDLASNAQGADDILGLNDSVFGLNAPDGLLEAKLGAVYRRYAELRSQLALANIRLVAHVAKRFRNRGVPYSDLIQEGFCGLLEAIDRFDFTRETKLATYATWWIRQSMQLAVAGGAYPVRLTPRHLRKLAQNQVERDQNHVHIKTQATAPEEDIIARILVATRPTISLNTSYNAQSDLTLLQSINDPDGDETEAFDRLEAIDKMLENLPPREQLILALRYGLGGKPQLSLSQVGKALEVSKERVRQIQDRALERLRSTVEAKQILHLFEAEE